MQLYVLSNGEQEGPFTPEQVRGYLNMGQYQRTDMAWHEGLPEWKPLSEFPEFAPTKHRTPNYKAMSYRKISSQKTKAGKGNLFAVLGLVILAAAGGGGYYYWHTQQLKKAEAVRQAAEAEAAKAAAAKDHYPGTLAELNRWYEEPAADQNAATFFQQGFDALQITDADLKSYSLPLIGKGATPAVTAALPGGTKTTVAAFLERNQRALDLFQKGVNCSGSRYPIDLTKGANTLLPHLAKLKQVAQLAELSAIMQADSRQPANAGQGVSLALASARSLEAEPLLISQLVRVANQGVAANALEQVVNHVTLGPETLAQLQTAFDHASQYEAAGTGFTRALVGERASGLETFDLPPEKLRELLPGGPAGAQAAGQEKALANLKEQQTFYDETLNQLFTARKESFPDRLKAGETLAPRITEAQSKGYVLCTMLLPALARTTITEAAALARLHLAQTAVALELFRAANGNSYPNSLNELAPKFLSAVPNDPFDGQPLRYRKAGEGYVLHSIGPNLKDDGAVRSAGSDDLPFVVVKPPKAS
jgi:GYF domain 2